jgi:redoxin
MRRIAMSFMVAAVVAGLLLGATGPATALEVGDKVPDFTLPATTQDAPLSMHDLLGKKNVLLFGFIGAFTPT